MLAWTVYLILGVLCLAFGWAWLAPRLPRRVRLAVLGLFAGLALLSMGVTAQIPHDYNNLDFVEYGHGVAALAAQLLFAIAGVSAALAAIGRRRTLTGLLLGVGAYLAGVGVTLYLMLEGQSTLHAPVLLFAGSSVALAAAGRLAGRRRWEACVFGLGTGVFMVVVAEALRGMGGRGGGPGTAAPASLLLLAIVAALLVSVGFLLRGQAQLLVGPLGRAAVAVVGTALVLVLRGPGEWAPGPHSNSTTLYGLPLTLLVTCVTLILLDFPIGRTVSRGRPAARTYRRRTAPAWPLIAGLVVVLALATAWRPAPDPCIGTPYSDLPAHDPGRAGWSLSPSPAAARGSPNIPSFEQACPQNAQAIGQLVYAFFPVCKWAQVDANYPLVQASGVLGHVELSAADSPWLHTSHDLGLDLAVEPSSAWLVLDKGPPGTAGVQGTAGPVLHAEVESGHFPDAYRPVAGDRVTVAGRWIYDCGHDPKTELHPAAIVASEHEEWRADPVREPQKVHVLQVWMNGAPGVVHVPLSPFKVQAGFPSLPAGQVSTPLVRVVAGQADAVRWTLTDREGPAAEPEATVSITPPASDGSSYFELLLGYEEGIPAQQALFTYFVSFDSLAVNNDLKSAAGTTTGILDLGYPQLGYAGSGHWFMNIVAGRGWRTLLANAPVEKGASYSLAAVPPVSMLAPGDEHLQLSVSGYAENDPATGVELASGSVDGAPILSLDAGRLADICCGKERTVKPANGAWVLSYHVDMVAP